MGNQTSTKNTENTENKCDHTFVFRHEKIGKAMSSTDSCEKCYGDRVVYCNELYNKLSLKTNENVHVHTWHDNECIGSIKCKANRNTTETNYEIISK